MPTGSWRTPLPSMIAIVLSELSRISSIKPRQRRRRRFGTNHTYSNRDHRLSECMSATNSQDDISARRTRATSLHLRDVLLPQAELLVDTKHVLADGQGGHAVDVVRNTAEQLRALASGERLPPRLSAAVARMHYPSLSATINGVDRRKALTGCPVHEVGGTLCGQVRAHATRQWLGATYHQDRRRGARACRKDPLASP